MGKKKYNPIYLETIKKFRLMDDTFFNICFADNKECIEQILQVILEMPKLKVLEVITQNAVPNIYGREVRFDVFAIDADGTYYNIEVQRDNTGANPKRPRYNSAMLDTMSVKKGTKWQELPKTIVIFITETDVLKGNKPIYHIHRKIDELDNKLFDDETEIIYVNGEYRADDALGRLMHDFNCTEPSEMHYKTLAEITAFFKNEPEGVGEMCEAMEKLVEQGMKQEREKRSLDIALRMLNKIVKRGKVLDAERIADIADDTEVSVDRVRQLAEENGLKLS